MALYTEHRPADFDAVLGNKATVASLKAIALRPMNKMPHVLLFHGPKGCGKTTLARIFASHIKCTDHNFHEMNSSQFRGIDTVRDITKNMQLMPMDGGKARVWLLDEVHMYTREAMNGLLKAFEDTPAHVFFLLCTTDPDKLIGPLKDRCTPFAVELLTEKRLVILMQTVLGKEKKKVPRTVLDQIAVDALGSARSALVILDMIIDLPEEQMLKAAKQTAAKQNAVIELCRLLFRKPKWDDVAAMVKGLEQEDPEGMRRMIMGYCSSVMLGGGPMAPKAWVVMDAFGEPFYDCPKARLVKACFEVVEGGH